MSSNNITIFPNNSSDPLNGTTTLEIKRSGESVPVTVEDLTWGNISPFQVILGINNIDIILYVSVSSPLTITQGNSAYFDLIFLSIPDTISSFVLYLSITFQDPSNLYDPEHQGLYSYTVTIEDESTGDDTTGYKVNFIVGEDISIKDVPSLLNVTKLPDSFPVLHYKSDKSVVPNVEWYLDQNFNFKATAGATILSNTDVYAKYPAQSSGDGGSTVATSYEIKESSTTSKTISVAANTTTCKLYEGDYGYDYIISMKNNTSLLYDSTVSSSLTYSGNGTIVSNVNFYKIPSTIKGLSIRSNDINNYVYPVLTIKNNNTTSTRSETIEILLKSSVGDTSRKLTLTVNQAAGSSGTNPGGGSDESETEPDTGTVSLKETITVYTFISQLASTTNYYIGSDDHIYITYTNSKCSNELTEGSYFFRRYNWDVFAYNTEKTPDTDHGTYLQKVSGYLYAKYVYDKSTKTFNTSKLTEPYSYKYTLIVGYVHHIYGSYKNYNEYPYIYYRNTAVTTNSISSGNKFTIDTNIYNASSAIYYIQPVNAQTSNFVSNSEAALSESMLTKYNTTKHLPVNNNTNDNDAPVPGGTTGGSCCFMPGTLVLVSLEGETRNIEDLRHGDQVISYNVDTKENYIAYVNAVFINEHVTDVTEFTLTTGETVTMNSYHPILTIDGWHSVTNYNGYKTLIITDNVKTITGYSRIKKMSRNIDEDNPLVMYNLDVCDLNELDHGKDEGIDDNFYANGICAHNKEQFLDLDLFEPICKQY